jgi:uncharacterized RDD family membrane protein YckC
MTRGGVGQARPVDQPTPPGPGWYPDATDPTRERWFDGSDWSPVTRPSPASPSFTSPSPASPAVPPAVPSSEPAWGTPPPVAPPGRGGEDPADGENPADGAQPVPAYGQPPANPYLPSVNPYAAPPTGRYASGDAPGGPPTGHQQPPATPPYPYGPGRPPVTGPTTPDGVPLAAPWLRLVARFLDWVIISVLAAVAGAYYLAQMVHLTQPELAAAAARNPAANPFTLLADLIKNPAFADLALRYSFVELLVGGVYSVVFTHLLGGTLGKLMVGVRVRSWDEPGRPTWGQALARWLTREVIYQVTFAGIGFTYWTVDSVWLLWDPRRQCLHDKLPGTVVVQHR